MSDPKDKNPKDKIHSNPLTSSAGGASGTKALGVKVGLEPAEKRKKALPAKEAAAPETPAPNPDVPEVNEEAAATETAPTSNQAEAERPAEPQAFAADLAAMPVKDLLATLPHALESRGQARNLKTTDAIETTVKTAAQVGMATRAGAETLFNQFSKTFSTAFGDAGSDAARITFTLVEFAQASARNNFQLAQDYAGARSVPDIVNVQAAYLKRQIELMNRQTAELRQLALEITSKNTAQLQGRVLDR